ncbi:MAG TPA: TetR/AcrR family transcriptional regulator [Terrimesophilobacter sp.]|nr:TetR/AcrR family transcriptional regulator [Terrimesophilobacter sp.]
MATALTDGRRRRGERSRRAVLGEAVNLASVEGLDGVSIGTLAERTGTSKSGVVALFGSKLDLQLATIRAAREIYIASIVEPTLRAPRGIARLWSLCLTWLEYSRGRTFEGGCFFRAAAAEADSKSGPVHDALVAVDEDWIAFVERCVLLAADDLPTMRDPKLLAFELIAFMDAANSGSLLHGTDRAYELAEAAMHDRLLAAGADPDALRSGRR